MEDLIKQILDCAIWAPSGDNSQPWRFEVKDNEIRVFNVPERDDSLYNYKQNGSLVALGALIENIKIISPYYGYASSANLSQKSTNSNLVAIVSLEKSKRFSDPLYPYIKERVSNRKPYEVRTLSTVEKQSLLQNDSSITDVSIKLVDNRGGVEALADAVSVNEKVVLENKKLHDHLFHNITWSEEEDEQKRAFFIKTLELRGPQAVGFKLCRHWPTLKLLNKIGVSNMVSRDNAKLYRQSGAFVAIVASDTSGLSFLQSGVVMQRFWLTATTVGLSVQPVTGVLFLRHRIKANGGELSQNHVALIETAYAKIAEIFEANEQPIAMMFRVGHAGTPTAKCLRREPEIKFLRQ